MKLNFYFRKLSSQPDYGIDRKMMFSSVAKTQSTLIKRKKHTFLADYEKQLQPTLNKIYGVPKLCQNGFRNQKRGHPANSERM